MDILRISLSVLCLCSLLNTRRSTLVLLFRLFLMGRKELIFIPFFFPGGHRYSTFLHARSQESTRSPCTTKVSRSSEPEGAGGVGPVRVSTLVSHC